MTAERIDAAVAAYREDPSPANVAELVSAQRAYVPGGDVVPAARRAFPHDLAVGTSGAVVAWLAKHSEGGVLR